MAITVTSVDPNSGLTRGDDIVFIIGTGFRLPPAPPVAGYLGGDQQKTVSVKFEGQESEWAYTVTATRIMARVPQWRGAFDISFPVSLDVRVANLDDDGDEITGDIATLSNGYSQDRQELASECYFQRTVRGFMELFQRHVIQNVHVTVSRDAANVAQTNDERMKAQSPAIHLIGPTSNINRFDSSNREEPVMVDATEWYRKRYPVTVDLTFDCILYANRQRHLFGMMQSAMLMFRDVTELRVLDDPDDDLANPTGTYKDYEIEMPWPFTPDNKSKPNDSDVAMARAAVKIIGVHIDREAGTIVRRGWIIQTNDGLPEVDTQPIEPTLPQ